MFRQTFFAFEHPECWLQMFQEAKDNERHANWRPLFSSIPDGTWRNQKGRTLELPDTLIAAIAIENDCALVTDNQKDFPMPEVKLYPP